MFMQVAHRAAFPAQTKLQLREREGGVGREREREEINIYLSFCVYSLRPVNGAGGVAHTCNFRTQEVEAGSRIDLQFSVSLGCTARLSQSPLHSQRLGPVWGQA